MDARPTVASRTHAAEQRPNRTDYPALTPPMQLADRSRWNQSLLKSRRRNDHIAAKVNAAYSAGGIVGRTSLKKVRQWMFLSTHSAMMRALFDAGFELP
jgi:hypothetical protein